MLAQRFGLIAGAAASTVVVAWLALSGGPAETVRAEVEPAPAGAASTASARSELAEGKRLFLSRDYAAAAAAFDRAATRPNELSAAERQDLDPFLTVFAFAAVAAVLGVLAASRTRTATAPA